MKQGQSNEYHNAPTQVLQFLPEKDLYKSVFQVVTLNIPHYKCNIDSVAQVFPWITVYSEKLLIIE